jgi:hypothetical protein
MGACEGVVKPTWIWAATLLVRCLSSPRCIASALSRAQEPLSVIPARCCNDRTTQEPLNVAGMPPQPLKVTARLDRRDVIAAGNMIAVESADSARINVGAQRG